MLAGQASWITDGNGNGTLKAGEQKMIGEERNAPCGLLIQCARAASGRKTERRRVPLCL